MTLPDPNPAVALALAEDVGGGDLTATLIPEAAQAEAAVVSRERAVLCGAAWFDAVFHQLDPRIHIEWRAADGDRVEQGQILLAAGEYHMTLKKDERGYYVHCARGEKVNGHCPSVDVLFDSVAQTAGKKAVGVILTGMGADGAKGLAKMHALGSYTIGQDKDTCVVYGMPMEAYKLGAVTRQFPLDQIGDELIYYYTKKGKI